MELRKTITLVAISALFTLAVFSFVIITQQQNNTEYLITNNSIINRSYGNLYGNVSNAQTTGDTAFVPFAGNQTPTTSYGIVEVNLVVSPVRIFTSFLIGTWNVLIELPQKILGVPPVVAGIINALLFLVLILGTWALLRGISY